MTRRTIRDYRPWRQEPACSAEKLIALLAPYHASDRRARVIRVPEPVAAPEPPFALAVAHR